MRKVGITTHSRFHFTGQAIFTLLIAALVFSCKHSDTIVDPWEPISDCITDVAIDYQSTLTVDDSAAVRMVFQQFIQHAKDDSLQIFGGTNNWRFESTSPHGMYKSVRYWKVLASWFNDQTKQWVSSTIFDVSQDGAVVRLQKCI